MEDEMRVAQDDQDPPPPPRLMISKIVCKNFKSYAGVQELGPFHKCFSSIVGPNGSGKSNVIDALLFVFGYRARKIRSKSVAVLIHKSENHPNLNSCTVTIHFQKIIDSQESEDSYSIVPGSEFSVSRTAFKDNSSHYQLNQRKLPFKDIAALLRQSGIDLDHNRFLILQGEVEQIAMMKPKAMSEHDEGLLEYLEDIVGTSRYKETIEELGKKVEELQENRGEKLNRFKAVEIVLNGLEGARNEALEYLDMQNTLSLKRHHLYEHYKYQCKLIQLQAAEKKDEVDKKLSEVTENSKESKRATDGKIKEYKSLVKRVEKLSGIAESSEAAIKSCVLRDTKATEEIKSKRKRNKKMASNLEKEKEKLKEYEEAPDKCQREIEEGNAKIKILEKRKAEEEARLNEIMSSLKEDTQGLQDEKEGYENKLVGLCQKVNETKSKYEVAKSELELYKERSTADERRLKEEREKLQEIKSSIADKNDELKRHEDSLVGMDQELSTCKENLKVALELRKSLPQLMKIARGQMQEAQSQKSKGEIFDALMKQKATGTIPGICGRLGDLGTIPDKYDVAISTACPALDYCVVDTMETAVQCVEFLKRADLGRATFMAVDKMERHRSNAERRVSTPQNVPRLFDLVTPKDRKYSTCFYHALGEMLVADNLDQATEIGLRGKTRHNVVTLQGHFISETGAMTGGGTRVIKGKMSSKIQSEYSPEEVKALKAKIESQESSFEQCRRNCSELEDRISTLEKEITACRKRIKELVHQIQILAEQEKGTTERIKQTQLQGTQNKIDPRELAKMEKGVAQHEKEYEKAAMAADEVKGIVQGLTEEIIRVGGSRLEQQQKFIDKIKAELKSSISSQSKAAVAIKSAERNAKKSREKIQSLESDTRAIEVELEALYKELKDLEEEATEAKDKMNSAKEQIEEKNGEIAEIKKEIQDMERQNRETNELMMDLKHELERYTARVKENQGKIEHFNNEIEKLALEDRPEFTDEDLENFDKQEGEYQITMLEERLSAMTPNMGAIEKYKRKAEELEKKKEELETATQEWEEARMRCEELRKRRHQEFMDGFTIISDKLKEMYQMITLGGDAELELVDSLDPFAEGITFSVRPPKKTWKCISNLSGGEKTLSSLALVFALHHYKPSPLYVMDEIDAALDCKNVSIVAHYIKERTKNAQFIIISLRNDMFELADRLVGIYKTYNCTKSVTIDPKKVEAKIRSMALAC